MKGAFNNIYIKTKKKLVRKDKAKLCECAFSSPPTALFRFWVFSVALKVQKKSDHIYLTVKQWAFGEFNAFAFGRIRTRNAIWNRPLFCAEIPVNPQSICIEIGVLVATNRLKRENLKFSSEKFGRVRYFNEHVLIQTLVGWMIGFVWCWCHVHSFHFSLKNVGSSLEMLFTRLFSGVLSMISLRFWTICDNCNQTKASKKLLQKAPHSTYDCSRFSILWLERAACIQCGKQKHHQFGDSI